MVTIIPYISTKISPEMTKAEITSLLKKHGIKDIAWVEYKGKATLTFIHRLQLGGVEKEIQFQFTPPQVMVEKRQYNNKLFRYEKIKFNYEPASYRLLFWYLDAKLKAIAWGLETIEVELFTHVVRVLPDGSSKTVGEAVKGLLSGNKLDQLSLEEKEGI